MHRCPISPPIPRRARLNGQMPSGVILKRVGDIIREGGAMSDAVIVAAVRTPVGKRNGGLSGVHPVDLSAHVLNALAERAGVNPEIVDDVIWGCVSQVGEQTFDIARNAVLAAGWPQSVPGVTVDRQCGSSQQSVHFAAAGLVSGQYDVVVAGGVESMSRVPMGSSIGPGRRQPVRVEPAHRLPRRAAEPGDRRGDDGRALGASPAPSSTSTRSPRTPRRPPRSTRAASPGRSPRSSSRTARSSTPTRGCAAAARSSRWPRSSPRSRSPTAPSTRATARRSATGRPPCS